MRRVAHEAFGAQGPHSFKLKVQRKDVFSEAHDMQGVPGACHLARQNKFSAIGGRTQACVAALRDQDKISYIGQSVPCRVKCR